MTEKGQDNIQIENDIYSDEKKLKNIKYNSFINGVLAASIVFFIIICLMSYSLYIIMNRYGEIGKDENVNKLMTVLKLYDEAYLNEINIEEMVDNAIYSIAGTSGDKYALYIPSSKAHTIGKQHLDGSYRGIGITYRKIDDCLEILSIVEDSPAGCSELKIGDKITHIDGEKISDEVEEKFSENIKNYSYEKIVLTINDLKEIELNIGDVNSPILDYEIDGDVGYMKIYQFVNKTFEKFTVGIDEMLSKNVKTIVFDLRDNGGGELNTVCNMLDYLIEEDSPIVSLKYVLGEDVTRNFEDSKSISSDIDIILVCNGDTASASELFIMTLQDYRNVVLCGTKTYGKSTVGQTYIFKDGSMLNISSGLYYPKSNRNIEGVGIIPDIILSEEDIVKESKVLYKEGKLLKN